MPWLASVFCGYGCLVSDLRYDVIRTVHGRSLAAADVVAAYAALKAEAEAWLAAQARAAVPGYEYAADVRYVGQSFDVAARISAEAAQAGDLGAIAASFHAEHNRLYGHAHPGQEIEIIALRLRIEGALPQPGAVALPPGAEPAVPRLVRARFDGAERDVDLHDWARLPPGWSAPGPLLVAQETATVVVPPGFSATIGVFGDLILERS